ncbi:MAG: hypothetical protein ACE5KM_14080 [Planctomycetaceae bacterium]
MRVANLTTAMHKSLAGIERATERVERIAETVARGIQDSPDEEFTRALAELPSQKANLRANVTVLHATDVLMEELDRLPRR